MGLERKTQSVGTEEVTKEMCEERGSQNYSQIVSLEKGSLDKRREAWTITQNSSFIFHLLMIELFSLISFICGSKEASSCTDLWKIKKIHKQPKA